MLVATGSRAEFGLLDPVMRAINGRPDLELVVCVAGSHLLGPAETWREVADRYEVAATIPMQQDGAPTSRLADAAALGRGIAGYAGAFVELKPGCVVVLGDRIEALAAAAAASVGGVAAVHLHGGDRAEGVADEAMRHAITKLAHLHLPATEQSAGRILRMGEDPWRVRVVGSPAIDGLREIAPMADGEYERLGSPELVLLLHPVGDDAAAERAVAEAALVAMRGRRVLALHPNHDPGREGVLSAIEASGVRAVAHLPRERFVGLLKRIAPAGALVGNSSAGLIEASALRIPAVNIGRRQSGRERGANVIDCGVTAPAIRDTIETALRMDRSGIACPFGGGDAGERAAGEIAGADWSDPRWLRKRNAY
ncbi:MAG: UDP-N-acetylglucosamine 2-epimerase (hydrolyzing) [Phycisphaeraceae bacterium]|nr:UDP-N-acetylglucosamine 2-epimerase (hydrolyzing) [Phycisphaeraceae bacterium]